MVEKKIGEKVIHLIEGDITLTDADAFVFDITEDAKLGSGYGGAIAIQGGPGVQKELDEIGSCPTGEAIITSAGKMKTRNIIHVNGPKFHEPGTEEKLRRATQAAMQEADKAGLAKLAFPPIGTGLYQVPLELCAKIMVDTVEGHLKGNTSLKEVVFVALDKREYDPFKTKLQGEA